MPFDRAGYINSCGGYGGSNRYRQGAGCRNANETKLVRKELHVVETYAKACNDACNQSYCDSFNDGCGYGGRGYGGCYSPCEPCGPVCEPCGPVCEPCGPVCEPCGPVCEPCGPVCEPCEPCRPVCDPCGPCGPAYEPCRPIICNEPYGSVYEPICDEPYRWEKPCKNKWNKPKKYYREEKKKNDPCNPFCKPCHKPVCNDPCKNLCDCKNCNRSYKKIYKY